MRGFVYLVISFVATVSIGFSAVFNEQLPRRLVLALDGVAYSDVERLQKGGYFSDFYPVSRNVATFPSISDTSWADIFRTEPPEGYQRYHYSIVANRIIGGALTDLGNPIEYEKKMHIAFESKLHHVRSYMSAMNAAKREIRQIAREFLRSHGRPVYYAYMLSTDTLQHTNGNIDALLKLLDRSLRDLQLTYYELTGERLEIVIVSDHGNNHENRGKRVPVKEHLSRHGFRFTGTIKKENDVAFTCAGILSAIAVYTKPHKVDEVAKLLLPLEGIDLVTNTVSDSPNDVLVRNRNGEAALVRKCEGESRYAYVAVKGDPLRYAQAVDALRAYGKLDDQGCGEATDWIEQTAALHYPAALERIYRGHHSITFNPARILVSLKDGYENANEFVKHLTKFKKRGGTHGALSAKSSNGVLMTNYVVTRDTTTNRVADIIDFPALDDYRRRERGGILTDGRKTTDYLNTESETYISFWDPAVLALEPTGIATTYRFEIKKDRIFFLNLRMKSVTTSAFVSSPDHHEFRLPLKAVIGSTKLKEGEYFLKVYAKRYDVKSGRKQSEELLFTERFYVGSDGRPTGF